MNYGDDEPSMNEPTSAPAARRSTSWSRLLPTLFFIATVAAVFVTALSLRCARDELSYDELITRRLATDTSVTHMINAVGDRVERNPPLYFVIAWGWSRVFGASEMSLRALSTTFVFLAVIVLRSWLRRRLGTWPATLAVSATLMSSLLVVTEANNARYYGLLVLLVAVALVWIDRLHDQRHDRRPSVAWWIGQVLIHAALCYTHVFGGVYSGFLLVALFVDDRVCSRRRLSVYASFVAGWALFLPWLPALRRQLATGSTESWIRPKGLLGLETVMTQEIGGRIIIALALVGGLVALDRSSRGARHTQTEDGDVKNDGDHTDATSFVDDRSLAFFGAMLAVGPPIVMFVFSQLVAPILVGRYFVAGIVGWCVVVAMSLRRIMTPTFDLGRVTTVGLTLVFIALPAWPIQKLARLSDFESLIAGKALERLGEVARENPGLPLVTEHPHIYLRLRHYLPETTNKLVLDWEASVNQGTNPNAANDYRLMEALRRNYPDENIVDSTEFMAHPTTKTGFLFLQTSGFRWAQTHLYGRPEWKIKKIAPFVFRVTPKN